MSFGLIYWILMLIWFVFGLVLKAGVLGGAVSHYGPFANDLLFFVLFVLLGWKIFGPPVHP